jgi:DNA-binding NarL/FixJ family response regulator
MSAKGGKGTKMKRILIVEDHAVFRQALATVLKRRTPLKEDAQAETVAEGVRHLGVLDGDIDVAIVGLGLPDGDGVELIKKMHEDEPDIPVLVLTVSEDPERHARAKEAGAERVLTKAASLEEVIDAIKQLAR